MQALQTVRQTMISERPSPADAISPRDADQPRLFVQRGGRPHREANVGKLKEWSLARIRMMTPIMPAWRVEVGWPTSSCAELNCVVILDGEVPDQPADGIHDATSQRSGAGQDRRFRERFEKRRR